MNQPIFHASSFAQELLKPPEIKSPLEILNPNSPYKHYVLGRNAHALSAIKNLRIDGVIDDFAPLNSVWAGLPVCSMNQVDSNSLVINCSLSISPLSAHDRLTKLIGERAITFGKILREQPSFPLPDFVAEMRNSLIQHGQQWEWLFNLLADDESKLNLLKILRFRLTGEISYMQGFTVQFANQYFDPIIQTTPQEIYVDCGGYDGDTALEFSKRYPHYSKIFVFEPSQENFLKAQKRLSNLKDCHIQAFGISDRADTLYFDAHSASASAVSKTGSTKIAVDTLDTLVQEKVTFIKMDIEGWELPALKGAAGHILKDHPKLAIAAYHQTNDFWEIPKFVLGLRSDYKVYLRHYSEGWSESVLYFIPSTNSM